MRKLIIAFCTISIMFIVSACTTSDDNIVEEQAIDYSPYSALLKAYELDYNIENLSSTDYKVTGMTISPAFPYIEDDSMVDASGFSYANLIDLDNNGVLELVIIAYNQQERGYGEYFSYDEKVYLDALEYPNIVKVYTIDQDHGLTFLGSLPVSLLELPTSSNYGIEYLVSEDKTYISHYETSQMNDTEIRYYGLSGSYFGVEAYFEKRADGTIYIEGEEYDYLEFDKIIADYGKSEVHLIQNLDETYLNELNTINNVTFSFLEKYPVSNFEHHSGAYNDGQFYYLEHNSYEYYPHEYIIKDYYNALTLQDYDKLYELMANPEEVEYYELSRSSDEHTYVPGYIITELQYVELGDVKKAAMATDISNYIYELDSENVVIMYAAVNEVLDPHTTQLGLQVAGDLFDTYYILSSEDKIEWKIEFIIDDKFYWN